MREQGKSLPAEAAASQRAAALLLFDGECGLCDRTVRRLVRADRRGALRFAPLQGTTAREIVARHGLTPPPGRAPGTMVLVEDPCGPREHVRLRSDGAIAAAERVGGIWRLASATRIIPRPWRDAMYDWVARHRHRMFGKADACPLPTPEMTRRIEP